jgi:hypothetical protein
MVNRSTSKPTTNMNTEKKLRGRPHKLEEDKLIGRRVSVEMDYWDVIDDFLVDQEMDLADLFRVIAKAIYAANAIREVDIHAN